MQVLDHVKVLVEGLPAGMVIEGSARVPVILRYAQTDGDPLEKFASELLNLPGGGHVALSTLVEAERVEGPVSVKREQGRRFVVVMSNVKDRDLVSFVEEAQLKIAEGISLPTGYQVEWGGEFENQQRAARRLMLVVPVAVVLIFLLLFSTFRSIVQAGLVLANVPLALIGGVLALALSGEYLSVPASVGFIALMGIAVLNGVVMVSYFNQLRSRGLPIRRGCPAGLGTAFASGHDDRIHRCTGADAAVVHDRAGLRDSETAGGRRDRRPDHQYGPDAVHPAGALPALYKV